MLNRALVSQLKPFDTNFYEMPYDFYIALVGTIIGERCHINKPLMLYRNHSNNVIGKATSYSKREILKKKLSNISFSLFKCRPSYLSGLELVYKCHKNEITNSEIYNNINRCILFFKTPNSLKKVQIVTQLKGVSLIGKVKQIIMLFLTIPSRMYLKEPYSIDN